MDAVSRSRGGAWGPALNGTAQQEGQECWDGGDVLQGQGDMSDI